MTLLKLGIKLESHHARWSTPITPILGRLRQEDGEFDSETVSKTNMSVGL
jgi:hypothetical protein